MGAIHVPPMSLVIEQIIKRYGVKSFIETGTYMGSAAQWAAQLFEQVHTVELNQQFYDQARTILGSAKNLKQHLGNSGEILSSLQAPLAQPSVIWLDAHSGGGNFSDEDMCPLMDELEAVNSSTSPHFIFIDDARAFVAPVPPPFDWKAWPPIDEVLRALQKKHRYEVAILNDTIIGFPPGEKAFLVEMSVLLRPKI